MKLIRSGIIINPDNYQKGSSDLASVPPKIHQMEGPGPLFGALCLALLCQRTCQLSVRYLPPTCRPPSTPSGMGAHPLVTRLLWLEQVQLVFSWLGYVVKFQAYKLRWSIPMILGSLSQENWSCCLSQIYRPEHKRMLLFTRVANLQVW